MQQTFSRTELAGISMPRMVIGSNWMLGYSHTSHAADRMIRERNGNAKTVAGILSDFLDAGVDAVMAPFEAGTPLLRGIRLAQERAGRRMILVDTPILNVDDNPAARREAAHKIARCRRNGATFCLIHHSSAEQLVNKNKRTLDRLPDYLDMIRQNGMIPGLSAHMPELILYADLNGYDVETYIQIYNCTGFMMQVEVENVHHIIWQAKKPVITIKPMAAGRVSPFVGLSFAWHTIRPCDLVTVGCFSAEEAREDIEISLAALENRPPVLEGRGSPCKTDALRTDDNNFVP